MELQKGADRFTLSGNPSSPLHAAAAAAAPTFIAFVSIFPPLRHIFIQRIPSITMSGLVFFFSFLSKAVCSSEDIWQEEMMISCHVYIHVLGAKKLQRDATAHQQDLV